MSKVEEELIAQGVPVEELGSGGSDELEGVSSVVLVNERPLEFGCECFAEG
jgi:hypothetical protein